LRQRAEDARAGGAGRGWRDPPCRVVSRGCRLGHRPGPQGGPRGRAGSAPVAQVDGGAQAAGRPRPHVAVFAYGAIDEDEEAALENARSIAAWFPQTAPLVCALWGLEPGLVAAVRDAYRGGEFQEAAAAAKLLPDDFV